MFGARWDQIAKRWYDPRPPTATATGVTLARPEKVADRPADAERVP